jgi:succinoglycan biosynthesis transport protein ExoP
MAENPAQGERHLRDYLHVIRKRWWAVALVFVVWVAVQGYRTARMTAVYSASAKVLIEKESPNILSIEEVLDFQRESRFYYKTQFEILRSRSFARIVLERLDPEALNRPPAALVMPRTTFETLADTVKSWTGTSEEKTIDMREVSDAELPNPAVDAFLRSIRIEPIRDTTLVNIRSLSTDPVYAARKANVLAEVYVDENLRTKMDATRDAQDWLDRQLSQARSKLEASEATLREYEEVENVFSLEERKLTIARKIEELNAETVAAKEERQRLEARYRKLQEVLRNRDQGDLDAVTEIMENPLIQSLSGEVARLEAELSDISKTFTPKHPKMQRLMSQLEAVKERVRGEEERLLQSVRHEYELALQREKELPRAVVDQKARVIELNDEADRYSELKKASEDNRRLYERLSSRRKETDLASELALNNVRIVDRAEIPRRPSLPNKSRNMAMALLVGLCLGVGLTFLLEYLDHTVKEPEDIKDFTLLGPVPILVPEFKGDTARDLITLNEPASRFSEAYRALRTAILFSSPDDPPRTLMVTSPGPREGKTVTAVNLAVAMAAAGKEVLLVDADMRKPRVHKVFGFQNKYGLSSVLGGGDDIGPALKQTKIPSLKVLTSGPIPPNPSELLGSERMHKLLSLLGERFDRIILDTTPLLAVTDASVLGSRSDGVILVIKAGATTKNILRQARKQFDDVKAKVLGVVLNQVDLKKSSYYYKSHYYYSYYGDGKKKESGSSKQSGKGVAASL